MKKSPKKEFLKTLRKYAEITELKDKPTEVKCHMAIPVTGDRGDRSSRVLAPTSETMPIIPPDVEVPGRSEHHNAELVDLARTVVPTDKEAATAKKARFRYDQLEKLDEILSGRRSNHGEPECNFEKIAQAWNMWMTWRGATVHFDASDVPIMMTLLKLAREAAGHSEDSAIDAAGYLLIFNELRRK